MSENYIPLYRKYRPQNLQEIVGQEHIKKALTNAISLKKISHAYLFTGPRGTGKTSTARILAKSLNCAEGPTLTPCEKCPSCMEIKSSTPIDVIEIDAASNRKVEDAQNILEKIQYVPVNGKYKIYIIDEVHMLTNHAFNALLKTLEEPPENVIFILATTEPQKVLETIISRCQRFDFRRITTEDIVNHLKNVSKSENIKIEEDALFTIAKNSAGGMRDSLALLDQVSVLDSAKTITTEDINKLLGRLSFDMLNKLSESIISSNPQEALEILETIYNSGNEPTQILINLLGYLKNLLVVKNCTGAELLLDLTQLNDSQLKVLKTQSEKLETHQITFLIEKIVYYIKELKTTTNQHLWLEVAFIDLANLTQNTSLLELQERLTRLESGVSNSDFSPITYSAPVPPQIKHVEKPININDMPASDIQSQKPETTQREKTKEGTPQSKPEQKPKKQEIQQTEEAPMPVSKPRQEENSDLTASWLQLLQNITSTPTVSLLTQHAKPVEISNEKIIIGCKENFLKLLSSDSKKSSIEDAIQKIFGKQVNLVIKTLSAEAFTEKKNSIDGQVQNKNLTPKPQENTTKTDTDEDDTDFAEHELEKKKLKNEKMMSSDQVSMVMNRSEE